MTRGLLDMPMFDVHPSPQAVASRRTVATPKVSNSDGTNAKDTSDTTAAAAAAARRANAEVQEMMVKMLSDEPYLPETEAVLRCHAKRRLYRAFKQASGKQIAEWLFAHPGVPFHLAEGIVPPAAFANSVAIHAQHDLSSSAFFRSARAVVPNMSGNQPSSAGVDAPQQQQPSANGAAEMNDGASSSPVSAGQDTLLVPVKVTPNGRVLGYTFGGRTSLAETIKGFCPFGGPASVFFPHAVGRFTFDPKLGDLLIVTHCLAQGHTGIMHFGAGERGVCDRDRAHFVVPGGLYGYRKLPGRILCMVSAPETRQRPSDDRMDDDEDAPRFQFGTTTTASMSGGRLDGEAIMIREALAKLERVVKGRFVCERYCKDELDERSGQVLGRITQKVNAQFDAMDVVLVQVFRDMAMRTYFSYLAAAQRKAVRTQQ